MNRFWRFSLVVLLASLMVYGSAQAQSTVEQNDLSCGSWQVMASPSPNGNGFLIGVAAVPGTTNVWSVGYYHATNAYRQTLIERWDSTSWQVVPSPNHPNRDHWLYDVAAVSENEAWAVGRYDPQGGGTSTLILHWDGTNWSIVPSPNPSPYSELKAIAIESPRSVWAVGHYYPSGGRQRTLIEHWDGTSWRVVPSPNVGSNDNLLNSVAVIPDNGTRPLPSSVWAIGYYYQVGNGPSPSTLTLRWDGTTWSVVPSPNGSTRENYMSGIAAMGTNDAWAVGMYNTPTGHYLPMTQHWDGTDWKVIQGESVSSSLTQYSSVAPISANDVWAVGQYYNNPAALLTLAQHWNGRNWQTVYTPNPGGESTSDVNSLASVVSVPGVGLWAVGYYQTAHPAIGRPQTLVEFYCPAP